jgi:membrane protein implicated in regulation of membrane protease activity
VIALGLALILIAAGATVFAVIASATTSAAIELTAFNVTIAVTPLALFIAGALVVALGVLGLALISRGTRRSARTHKELKALRKENAIAATRAAAERENVAADSTPEGTDSSASGTRQAAGEATGKNNGTRKGPDDSQDTEPPVDRRPQNEQRSLG